MARERAVVAVACDGLCAFEMGIVTELFGLPRPEIGVAWYELTVVAADPPPLRTLGGMTIDAPVDLDLIRAAGTVVVPGWRRQGPIPERLLDALRDAHVGGARMMSICSGAFLLAAAGLLDGRPATTHWRYAAELSAAHPTIDVRPEVLFVDDGDILTSAGSAAGLDLGLHLIRRDHGAEVANAVARRLVVPRQRDGGQAQFIERPVPDDGGSVMGRVLDWALERLDQPITVADMAAVAAMSPRTFARRFGAEVGSTPHAWLVRQRVGAARALLETTDLTVDEVAVRCGFGGAAGLRHHFGRELLTTPTAYRSGFRSARRTPGAH